MNILVLDSWLREYLETNATPQDLKDCLSLCGPSIERISKIGNDYVYDIEITSNRIDMASVFGVAREAAAILPNFGFKAELKLFGVITDFKPIINLPIKITDTDKLCKRVLGIVLEVDGIKDSPDLIKYRLENSGVRSLNDLVDITNYVMLEIGHPCHVFDYDRIKTHQLIIRRAKKGEEIITLDNKKYNLNSEDIIIDDGAGRVIDLPGIMGTQNSVITDTTKRILFFLESNNPMSIRKSSMRYGIRTMAAAINEKSPDPELAKTALLYGVELYQKIANATIASKIIDIYPDKKEAKPISVQTDFINTRLGIVLKQNEIVNILESLNFTITQNKDVLTITPPSYRQYDILIAEDIVEEVARIYGYHNLPNNLMEGKIPVTKKSKDLSIEEKIKLLLKYSGLTETYSYSMLSQDLLEKTEFSLSDTIRITNPLNEELVFMRKSLIPQMLSNLAINQNLSNTLSFFELSKIYLPNKGDLPCEKSRLCLGLLNRSYSELKGIIESLLKELGITEIKFRPPETKDLPFIPNKSAEIICNNKPIGIIGIVKNTIKNKLQISNTVVIADMDFDEIVRLSDFSKKYTPIPNYPPLIQDLALILHKNIFIQDIIDEVKKTDKLIFDAYLYDSYENTKTIRIVYQDKTKTLSEENVKPIRLKLLKMLEEKFGTKLKS